MIINHLLQKIASSSASRRTALALATGVALISAAPHSAIAQERGDTLTAEEAASIPELEPDAVEGQRLRDASAADRLRAAQARFRVNAGAAHAPGATEEQLRQALSEHAVDTEESGVAPER